MVIGASAGILVIALAFGAVILKQKRNKERTRQIGMLSQSGLYPNMSSYRQNRFNISNNNRSIPTALLPPMRLLYLPLNLQPATGEQQRQMSARQQTACLEIISLEDEA